MTDPCLAVVEEGGKSHITKPNCKNEPLLIKEGKTLLLQLAAGQLKVIRAYLAEILLMK